MALLDVVVCLAEINRAEIISSLELGCNPLVLSNVMYNIITAVIKTKTKPSFEDF